MNKASDDLLIAGGFLSVFILLSEQDCRSQAANKSGSYTSGGSSKSAGQYSLCTLSFNSFTHSFSETMSESCQRNSCSCPGEVCKISVDTGC